MDDLISWISKWRDKYCDRDWETENGFEISAISNPGWSVKIDLNETTLESASYESGLVENSSEYLDEASSMVLTKHDWYNISIKGGKFSGSGDNSKLSFILSEFKLICLENGEDLSQPRAE